MSFDPNTHCIVNVIDGIPIILFTFGKGAERLEVLNNMYICNKLKNTPLHAAGSIEVQSGKRTYNTTEGSFPTRSRCTKIDCSNESSYFRGF
ncbi:hypothetical protein Sjap_022900 [Stephania japonica]|uniref:Uncharacterized protein n=1 Tax=Stephania japonica TaxID=461633 RepID=A0AAP0EWW7_9MAGN